MKERDEFDDKYDRMEADDEAGKVRCDDFCGALKDPQTLDEYKAALDHWHHHGLLHGCSHAN